MKITRRAAAQILTSAVPAALATSAAAQTPAQPNDAAQRVREQFEKSARAMAAVKIPMATEPPFHFRP